MALQGRPFKQPDATDELRDALMALEWRRQVLNMQLSGGDVYAAADKAVNHAGLKFCAKLNPMMSL